MTLTGYNSAEGQQSAAIKSQGFIGHIDFILMTGGSEINLLFTGSDPHKQNQGGNEDELLFWRLSMGDQVN